MKGSEISRPWLRLGSQSLRYFLLLCNFYAGVDVILNKESNRETPSVITFNSKQRQMGTDAAGALATNPCNTIILLKRLLGKKFNDPVVQTDLKYVPYSVSQGPRGECLFNVQYLDKPMQLTGEQVMAAMLVDLKEIAEVESGAPISEAVLSVPAFFTEPERHAMLAAAQIAGLNCLRLLNETTATALSYGIYKTDLSETEPANVVFIDVGHTATQVCVVALKKGELAVLSNAWDRDLGGRTFDNALFDHYVAEFNAKYKVDIASNPRAALRLRVALEKAKRILTTNPEAALNVECLINDIDVSAVVTRDLFEELIQNLLGRLLNPVQKALADAGLTVEQIANVEVVGGSTRVPAVQRLLTEFFGREPSRTLNAKETVARGCALQCAMLSPTFRVRDFQVRDAFPYGVQFSWDKDGEMLTSQVFEKGSHVPSTKMLSFFRKGPFEVHASYTDDSDIPSTADRGIGTWKIGSFSVPKGQDKPKVKLRVVLNLNGVVTVDSAHVVEEEEYEEEVAVEKDTPMTEASEQTAAEEGEGAAAALAPAENGAQPEKKTVKKKRTKKHPVQVEAKSDHAVPAKEVQKLYEVECEMALQQKVVAETNDAKNAVEAYIYSLRNRLHDSLAPYATDDKKSQISLVLEDAENWLYEEGEDAAKSVYVAKLGELRKLGAPIETRAAEDSSRGGAAAKLRAQCERYLAVVGEARYAHIDPAELAKVADEAQKALAWLGEKEAAQANLNKYDDPVLVTSDIEKKRETVERYIEPILAKPVPLPPKKEEEPAPPGETPMETEEVQKEAEPAVETEDMKE